MVEGLKRTELFGTAKTGGKIAEKVAKANDFKHS
jgi:hypothetical protein